MNYAERLNAALADDTDDDTTTPPTSQICAREQEQVFKGDLFLYTKNTLRDGPFHPAIVTKVKKSKYDPKGRVKCIVLCNGAVIEQNEENKITGFVIWQLDPLISARKVAHSLPNSIATREEAIGLLWGKIVKVCRCKKAFRPERVEDATRMLCDDCHGLAQTPRKGIKL